MDGLGYGLWIGGTVNQASDQQGSGCVVVIPSEFMLASTTDGKCGRRTRDRCTFTISKRKGVDAEAKTLSTRVDLEGGLGVRWCCNRCGL